MEHNDHEAPKPSNKWLATPILMAFLTIAALVTFLSFATGTCCGGDKCCKEKAKTEEHGGEHGTTNEHGTSETTNENTASDSTATTTDSTATHEGHEGHGEGDGHGH